ncbi:MAG: sugar phosphate isomerase/epimerase [Spirochaetes bacterium]|nr:sugar phosphate isomerase/epimerase [Spirochaetota bacterium]
MRLAVQTFTVRRDARRNLPETLARLKATGIEYLELARIKFSRENAETVAGSGLGTVAIQVTFNKLQRRFSQMVRFCRITGCSIVVVSVLPTAAILGFPGALGFFARQLSLLARRYAAQGIRLAFHHHDFEFHKSRGSIKLERLQKLCTPDVHFVMDTYWVARSGFEPLAIAKMLGSRLLGLHLRDLEKPDSPAHGRDCALGSGCINFEALVKNLPDTVVYGAIEQNSSEPWESLRQSIAYCRKHSIGADNLESKEN